MIIVHYEVLPRSITHAPCKLNDILQSSLIHSITYTKVELNVVSVGNHFVLRPIRGETCDFIPVN